MKKTIFAWHIHHDVLVEPLREPIKNRIEYIKRNKPKNEVDLRLRLLKVVKGKLPDGYDKALEAYGKAWEAYGKALEAYGKAWEAYFNANKESRKEVEMLHKKECGCGWNGETIFTKANGFGKEWGGGVWKKIKLLWNFLLLVFSL